MKNACLQTWWGKFSTFVVKTFFVTFVAFLKYNKWFTLLCWALYGTLCKVQSKFHPRIDHEGPEGE
jgi:hypothetical protein